MADEFWQHKELLSAQRDADPPTAILIFFECLHFGGAVDG